MVPVPAPPSPAPNPPVVKTLDRIAQVILDYNNNKSYFVAGPSWSIPTKGVTIHKITFDQAQEISDAIQRAIAQYHLPLTFVLACLAVESVLDPGCENGNFMGSNTSKDPLGFDDGIAQLKLRYLVGAAYGILNALSAQAFAFDVNRAIPYFCSLMAGKVKNAQTVIAESSSTTDVRLRNPLVYATGAYNFGDTGMLKIFESGAYPSHCSSVVADEQYFASKLGVASVFADLPK